MWEAFTPTTNQRNGRNYKFMCSSSKCCKTNAETSNLLLHFRVFALHHPPTEKLLIWKEKLLQEQDSMWCSVVSTASWDEEGSGFNSCSESACFLCSCQSSFLQSKTWNEDSTLPSGVPAPAQWLIREKSQEYYHLTSNRPSKNCLLFFKASQTKSRKDWLPPMYRKQVDSCNIWCN